MTPTNPRKRRDSSAEIRTLALTAAREAVDRRAQDVVLLDLRGLTSATDYFILASGESDVQVRAIAERVQARLAEEDARPWHVEGTSHAQWILLDYIDFVVHVFHREARAYYELERLWADAESETISDAETGREAAGVGD